MQLILARRRSQAEDWANTNGHNLRIDWHRLRSDSTVYVHLADQLRGRTLTGHDTIIVLPGFEQRANSKQILEGIDIASMSATDGGPTWETR